ncbi:hypothetical protein U1Q18_034421 [Sarracenia purpurea var. burkii]
MVAAATSNVVGIGGGDGAGDNDSWWQGVEREDVAAKQSGGGSSFSDEGGSEGERWSNQRVVGVAVTRVLVWEWCRRLRSGDEQGLSLRERGLNLKVVEKDRSGGGSGFSDEGGSEGERWSNQWMVEPEGGRSSGD